MNEKKQETKIRAVCVIWFQSKIPENCKATCMFSSDRKVINNCTTSNLGTKEIQRQTQQPLLVTHQQLALRSLNGSEIICVQSHKFVENEFLENLVSYTGWQSGYAVCHFFSPQNQISFRVGDEQTLRVTPSSWATVSRQSNIMRYHVSAAIKPHEWF